MATPLITTDTDVANFALDMLGVARIQNIADRKKVSEVCYRNIAQVRREILTLEPWSICTQRKIITKEVGTPPFGYSYKFLQPKGCIRIWKLNGYRVPKDGYSIEAGVIYANVETLYIKYARDNDTYVQWPPLLLGAFAARLAIATAASVAVKLKDIPVVQARYEEYLGDAIAADCCTDEQDDARGVDQWELERNYGTGATPMPTEFVED